MTAPVDAGRAHALVRVAVKGKDGGNSRKVKLRIFLSDQSEKSEWEAAAA